MTLTASHCAHASSTFRRITQRLACIGAATLLVGCSTTANVYERHASNQHPGPVHVTPGQTLEVFFNGLTTHSTVAHDLQAWQSTGLFTSVKRASADTPSPNGYFLRVSCQRDDWENDSGFMELMLWVLTLGTFPALAENSDESCKLTMYENALQVASATAYLQVRTIGNGWGVIPSLFTKKSRYASYAQTSANVRVRNTLMALSKVAK